MMTTIKLIYYYYIVLGIAFAGSVYTVAAKSPTSGDIVLEVGPVEKSKPQFRLPKSVEDAWEQREQIQDAPISSVLSVLVRFNQIKNDALEQEIINIFREDPTGEAALFLGLCESEESERLLLSSVKHTDAAIRNNVKLALARRNHEAYGKEYIDRFKRHPISNRLSVEVLDDAEAQSIWNALEYIGTPDAYMALCDAIANWGRNSDRKPTPELTAVDVVRRMRRYLDKVGAPVPEAFAEHQEYAVWWKEHRAQVDKILRQQSADLPRLSATLLLIKF